MKFVTVEIKDNFRTLKKDASKKLLGYLEFLKIERKRDIIVYGVLPLTSEFENELMKLSTKYEISIS